MPIFAIARSSLDGDLSDLSTEAWATIERAARRRFGEDARKEIKKAIDLYCGLQSADRNWINIADIEAVLERVEILAGKLGAWLVDDQLGEAAKRAHELFMARLSKNIYLGDRYASLKQIVDAARKARKEDLPQLTELAKRGRKTGTFSLLVDSLAVIFEAAGGKATVSTRYVNGRAVKDSPFAGFVYEVLMTIPIEGGPRPPSRNAVADRIRARKRRGKKGTPSNQ